MIEDIYNSIYRSIKLVYPGADLALCYSLLPWESNYKELSEGTLFLWMQRVIDAPNIKTINSIEMILGSILIEEGLEPTYNPVVDAIRVRHLIAPIETN
jgi:hypothetical protein